MANKITFRKETGVPSVPTVNIGEPVWDQVNGKLYIKNLSGGLVELGGAPASGTQDYGFLTQTPVTYFDYGTLS